MKRARAIALCLVLAVLAGTVRAEPASLPVLEACVVGLEASSAGYRRHVPAAVLSADRRVHRMLEGVAFQRGNFETLKSCCAGEANPIDRHLVDNAVIGCRSYHAALETRFTRYLFFVCSMSLFLLVLLAQATVELLGTPPKRPQAPAPPAEEAPPQAKIG